MYVTLGDTRVLCDRFMELGEVTWEMAMLLVFILFEAGLPGRLDGVNPVRRRSWPVW